MKQAFAKKCAFLLATLAFTACSKQPVDLTYAQKHPPIFFDNWQFVPASCMIYTNVEDIHLRTDGRINDDAIYVKLTSNADLARSPIVQLNTMPYLPIRIEGTGRDFSFEFPYLAASAAKLLNDSSFFIISYKILGQEQYKKIFIPTRKLPLALAKLSDSCGKQY